MLGSKAALPYVWDGHSMRKALSNQHFMLSITMVGSMLRGALRSTEVAHASCVALASEKVGHRE
eukprot:4394726-Amphidinium_carterae.1